MKKLAYSVIGIAGILAFLILAKDILIPFVYGVILWFLGRFFKYLAYKIPFFKKHLPSWLVSSVTFIFIVLVLVLISTVLTSNVNDLIDSYPGYQENINIIVEKINGVFNIDVYKKITERLRDFEFGSYLKTFADALSAIFGNIVMVLLYAVFVISEENSFMAKWKKLFRSPNSSNKASDILHKINTSLSDYIRLKTIVSVLTGVVGYVFLVIMKVDAPFFWALLMFLLNYIPTIGSTIATIFPAFFSLIQFGEFTPFLIILVGLGVLEWIIGNIIEPKIMGKSLNISPLVTIIALVAWGQIWGITGMVLSVPITVVMITVFSQFESTKKAAIMLSENGDFD
ncbi:MAG: AI-2 transport protein TqsA [Patiriisocius sp.]|jgi:AI-2 transport protein TqsA